MPGSDSFDDLIGRLRQGDEDAAAEVFRRFAARLVGLARKRLAPQVRAKVDPEDVLQSVFRSFFVRHSAGQFYLDDWDCLWSLLARITLRKCGRRMVAFHGQGRDARRELRLPASDEESRRHWEAMARDPTPEEAVALADTLEHLMRGLDQTQRQMVVLRLQGYSVAEISQHVGRAERTIRRLLAQVREGLERLEEGPNS